MLSRVQLFVTPWIAARQASLSITNSWSSLRPTSIKSVMPSSHLIICRPLLLLPPIPPSIRVFSNESTLSMMLPKYWSFSFSIIPSKEIPGLISFILKLNKVSSRLLKRGSCCVCLLYAVDRFYQNEPSVCLAVLTFLLYLLWDTVFPSLVGPSQVHISTEWGLLPYVKGARPHINKLSYIQFCNSLRWVQTMLGDKKHTFNK